jgi:predicted permease
MPIVKKQSSGRKIVRLSIAVVIVAGLIVSGLFIIGVLKIDKKNKSTHQVTGSSYTKGIVTQPSSNSSTSTPSTASVNSDSTKDAGANTNNVDLLTPSGTFANVYNASQDEEMSSTCNTTPGASCQIFFTDGSITKSLPLKQTDKGGAAYWAWKPSDGDVGLTPGTWQITATATAGGTSKTANNGSLALTITQ